MTSSRLGAVPITAQKTFCPVPANGKRSSHHGLTSVEIRVVGIGSLKYSENGAVKLTFPLLPMKSTLKLPPPKAIGNGKPMANDDSSLRFRLLPLIVR